MSELVPFSNDRYSVRTLAFRDGTWFVAKDVTKALGLSNITMALQGLDDDEKGFNFIDTPGGQQKVSVVSEPGLYALIQRSNKPEAKQFKRWINHDVLPAIRQTGGYIAATEQDTPEVIMAKALQIAQQTIEQSQRRVAELEPKAEAYEVLASAKGDYSVREAASLLNRAGIDTGQNRLFRFLEEHQMIDQEKRPYARHRSHLRLREQYWTNPKTDVEILKYQLRVTAKGVDYLRRRMAA